MDSELMRATCFGDRLYDAYFVTREQQPPMSYSGVRTFFLGFTYATKNNAILLAFHICTDRMEMTVAFYSAAKYSDVFFM